MTEDYISTTRYADYLVSSIMTLLDDYVRSYTHNDREECAHTEFSIGRSLSQLRYYMEQYPQSRELRGFYEAARGIVARRGLNIT